MAVALAVAVQEVESFHSHTNEPIELRNNLFGFSMPFVAVGEEFDYDDNPVAPDSPAFTGSNENQSIVERRQQQQMPLENF